MVDKLKQKAGRAGAAALHKTRWEILKKLSGLYSKKQFEENRFMNWRTWQLEILIKWVEKEYENKNNN